MKKLASLVIIGFLAACSDSSSPTAAPPRSEASPPAFARGADGEPIPGQYIVVFKSNVTDVAEKAKGKVKKHGGKMKHSYASSIKGFAAELSDAAVEALRADPDVDFVEADQVMTASTIQTGATWGLDRVDQRALPLNSTYSYLGTGAGVTAYIIDTGILFAHSEFGGRAITGFDAVTSGGSAADCNGHGTHVSGTVGGATYGIAKQVTLVAVRVLDCNGSGSTSGVIAGIDWVTSNHAAGAPAVANMSLGGGASSALDAAVKSSIADGVTYAIAAGNGNWIGIAQDACKSSPARVPEAITVSATDKTDRKASWANYGSCVDLFAPGVSITSSWYSGTNATNTISGTSMATPHVTGIAALYVGGHAGATPQQVRDAVVANATPNVVGNAKGSPNLLLFSSY